MELGLSGRRAIVCGASAGLGRACAQALSNEGVEVVLAARTEETLKRAAGEIAESSGFSVDYVAADVTTEQGRHALLGKCPDPDILINNAGITRDNLLMRMKEEDWDTVLETNLKGAFTCAKAVARPMMKARFGRIIGISSVVGIVGNAGQANYAASKAGLIGFSKSLARELASRSITVNIVAPGFVPDTGMTGDLPEAAVESMMSNVPLGRSGTPEEVADAVAFLASDRSAYITGQVLAVDGGMTM